MMQTLVRGYNLVRQVYANELFRICEASHSVLQGQQLRITVINNYFSEIREVRSEFNASAFRLGFAEHPYIIRNIDMIEENDVLAILSEDISLRNSSTFVNSLSRDEKMEFVMKIMEALIYLNDRKIFHLSPEPEDILIDENNNPRLCNYGLADIFLKIKNEEDRAVVLSNFKYAAPELHAKNCCGDEKAEVFAFGKYLKTVFGEDDTIINKIVDVATNPDRNKRFRNLNDLGKAITNPEKLETYIPETVSEHIPQTQTAYFETPEERLKVLNDDDTVKRYTQAKENMNQILDEIENEKKPEPPKQTHSQNSAAQQQQVPPFQQQQQKQQQAPPVQQQQQNTNQYTQKQQQQTDYNRTREAIRQSAYQQQSQTNTPKPAINTTAVVVLGFLSIIFGFIFSLVGFVLAIVGFNNASNNKKKAAKMGRQLSTNEINTQTIGIVLCVIGLIVSIGNFLAFLGSTFG
ncbi:MAG: protein kinase [Bacteroidales bacterium]|nr:protein kinase [Bacteroidales bacterium]